MTGPLALGGALSVAAAMTPLDGLGSAAVGFGAVTATLLVRGTATERVTRAREGVRSWRALRGSMPERDDISPEELAARGLAEGEFLFGEGAWPDLEPVIYRPLGGHAPHLFVAGTTGFGKSEGLTLLALQAIAQGLRVVILDPKGGEEFGWLEDLDYPEGQVELAQTPDQIQRLLRETHEAMETRYAEYGTVRIPERDTAGVVRMVKPKNYRRWASAAAAYPEATPAPTFRPMLVLADELDAILGHPKLGEQNTTYLEGLAARARGAAIILGLSTQSPYANIVSGFVKANVGARLHFGAANQVQADMVIGEEARHYLAAAGAPTERPAGRAVWLDGTGSAPRIVQAKLLDVARLAPTEDEWRARGTTDATTGGTGGAEGAGQEPTTGEAEEAVGQVVALHRGTPGGRSVVDSGALGDRPAGGSEGPSAEGLPYGVGETPASGPTSHPSDSTSDPLTTTGDHGRPRASVLLALAARTAVVAPLRRLALRATVWRLVLGPRVRGRAIRRDRSLRRGEERESGGVCDICRRPPMSTEPGKGWQADHRRPLWAGGRDEPANIWTLCTRCHLVKTKAEKAARKWRDRTLGLAALERAPLYVWSGLAALLWALLHAAGFGPYRWWSPLLAALVAWGFWRTRPAKGNGLDGVAELEKAEGQARDTVGDAAGAWIWWARKWHGFRLGLGLAAHLYLGVRLVVAVARWRLGL